MCPEWLKFLKRSQLWRFANAHFKHMARALGVEVGVKSRKERGCVPCFCCPVLLFSDDFWLIWISFLVGYWKFGT